MAGKVFVLILAETSLETIPTEIAKHPAVAADVARRAKPAEEVLLDRSVHHAAILRLKDGEPRGRPDIAYHVLLDVTSSPLYRAGRLEFFMHTRGDLMLTFSKGLRPPRSYDRFRSLMEQLFKEGRVGDDEDLITLNGASFKEVVERATPSTIVGLSKLGKAVVLHDLISTARGAKPCFVVGGFPSGHFSKETEGSFDTLASIHREGLDASLVACRLVYEMENLVGQ